jgi:hypothetical protein
VDSVNASSDYFEYLCFPVSETTLHQKECHLQLNLTFVDRLLKPTAKMNSACWNALLQDMDYGCFTGSKLQQ